LFHRPNLILSQFPDEAKRVSVPLIERMRQQRETLIESGGSGKLDRKVFFLSEALPG
jgi:hypothetical protein